VDGRASDGRHPLGTILVTGGASGLGAAVAQAVLDEGGTPVVLDRRPAEARFEQAQADLDAPRFAEDVVREVAARHDDLRGVVALAALDADGRLDEVDAETWDRALRVNVIGTAAVVRAALPALERNGGSIVTVTGEPGATASAASRAAIAGFTQALRHELAGRVDVTLLDARESDPAGLVEAALTALGR
jgi:NAD(P)-dependent dehydrogenase (short-subunit alcohol dehydrogenase family)